MREKARIPHYLHTVSSIYLLNPPYLRADETPTGKIVIKKLRMSMYDSDVLTNITVFLIN